MKTSPHDIAMEDLDIRREREFSGASRIIFLCTLLFAILGIWAGLVKSMKSPPAMEK